MSMMTMMNILMSPDPVDNINMKQNINKNNKYV